MGKALVYIAGFFLILGFIVGSSGCGKAAGADSISVEVVHALDGTRCYVIMQAGEARGGNCNEE